MGAGSIGCYVGGRLALSSRAKVSFVGRAKAQTELTQKGMKLQAFDTTASALPPDRFLFSTEPQALRTCDVVLVCVKSAHTEAAAHALAPVLATDALVLSFQNGISNTEVLSSVLGPRQVRAAVVGFNVVSKEGGLYHRTTDGPLMLQAGDAPQEQPLQRALRDAGFEVQPHRDLIPHQWTKLLINLNNAVSALSGAPTSVLLTAPQFREVIAALVTEALGILRAAEIRPAKLKGVPVAWMPKLLGLPTGLVKLLTRAQLRVDPQARSSMWEDLSRGRPTEVDHLNGAIVSLATKLGREAPLNARITALVHEAEQTGASPNLSGAQLLDALELG